MSSLLPSSDKNLGSEALPTNQLKEAPEMLNITRERKSYARAPEIWHRLSLRFDRRCVNITGYIAVVAPLHT
jgi:hypothetical protein